MSDSIYEELLKGRSVDVVAKKFGIDLNTLQDLAKTKIDYDGLSPLEREKVLHTLSLIQSKSWDTFEKAPIEVQVKILDLLRRLNRDRADVLGLTKDNVTVDGSIEISWKKDDPVP